jgi:outer membrane protein assembly factor BamB
VYVGSDDGFFYALDATDGSMLWLYDVGATTPISRMIVSDGIAYANSYGGETVAFALGAGNNVVRQNLQPPALSSLHPDMSLTVTR